MITIKDKATITKREHLIMIDVGEKVPEGEYEVEVTLKSLNNKQIGILNFPTSNLSLPPNTRFDRHEIYGDDGR